MNHLLKKILWYFKQFASVVWRGTPWAIRLIWFVGFFAFRLSILSLFRWLMAAPEAARKVADVWANKALAGGFPSLWETQLRFSLRIVAYLSFFLGWSLTLFALTFTVNLLI